MVEHSVACCTDAGVRGATTGVGREHSLHGGQNKRVVCYVSVSLVLLPAMHNECPRHALSIEFEYKLTRVSLTWLPRPGPNSVCVKATVPLFCFWLGSKPRKQPKVSLGSYSVLQHLLKEQLWNLLRLLHNKYSIKHIYCMFQIQ